jgi:hypothetical protein
MGLLVLVSIVLRGVAASIENKGFDYMGGGS